MAKEKREAGTRIVIKVEFELSVLQDATFEEVDQWVSFELCGGSIKTELLKRMGDFEPDPSSIRCEF